MNIGIVFYSRTGNTKQAAKIIEKKLIDKKAKVDLIEIKHLKKPGFFKAGRAAMTKKDMEIKNTNFDLKKYDFLVLGFPTWAGRPSPYANTFMSKAENIKEKKVAIFNTCGGSIENNQKIFDYIIDDMNNLGLNITDQFLCLQMRKEKIVDGEQNIDKFIAKIVE